MPEPYDVHYESNPAFESQIEKVLLEYVELQVQLWTKAKNNEYDEALLDTYHHKISDIVLLAKQHSHCGDFIREKLIVLGNEIKARFPDADPDFYVRHGEKSITLRPREKKTFNLMVTIVLSVFIGLALIIPSVFLIHMNDNAVIQKWTKFAMHYTGYLLGAVGFVMITLHTIRKRMYKDILRIIIETIQGIPFGVSMLVLGLIILYFFPK